jgi:hypothetical protein
MGAKILKTLKLWAKCIIIKMYFANFCHFLDPYGSLFSSESFFSEIWLAFELDSDES